MMSLTIRESPVVGGGAPLPSKPSTTGDFPLCGRQAGRLSEPHKLVVGWFDSTFPQSFSGNPPLPRVRLTPATVPGVFFPQPQCSSGTSQSRPFPARPVKGRQVRGNVWGWRRPWRGTRPSLIERTPREVQPDAAISLSGLPDSQAVNRQPARARAGFFPIFDPIEARARPGCHPRQALPISMQEIEIQP